MAVDTGPSDASQDAFYDGETATDSDSDSDGGNRTDERLEAIPEDATKRSPDDDYWPPILNNDQWEDPIPMPGPVNTAGAEDAPFITPDGHNLLFFFTPDTEVPAEEQLVDGVTGIWRTRRSGGEWTTPQRVVLNDDVALDGCPFLRDDELWFCSVRADNYTEIDMYLADWNEGTPTNWRNAGARLNQEFGVGEVHLGPDADTLYFHMQRADGHGRLDLWSTKRTGDSWSEPANLGRPVNTNDDESRPFVTSDGQELWFTAQSQRSKPGPATYRSKKQPDGTWGEPVEIVSQFAGEPTLDDEGNLYFVHHYYSEDLRTVFDVDIYVAYRKN